MKIGTVLAAVHESETALYHRLLALSQQYVTEHEIHHVAKDVAQWFRNHLKDIAELDSDYDQALNSNVPEVKTVKHAAKRSHDATLGVDEPVGLGLLWDLRDIHMLASGISMQWTMLSQAAQALRDSELSAMVTKCQAETDRQKTWAKAQIKQLSAQTLVS